MDDLKHLEMGQILFHSTVCIVFLSVFSDTSSSPLWIQSNSPTVAS